MSRFSLSRSGSLWIQVMSISLAVHLGLFLFFYFHPLRVRSPSDSLFFLGSAEPKKISGDPLLDAIEKNEIIQEVFEHILVLPSKQQRPYDLNAQGVGIAPQPEKVLDTTLAETEPFTALFDKALMAREVLFEEIDTLPVSPLFEELQERARRVADVDVSLNVASIGSPSLEKIEISYTDLASEISTEPKEITHEECALFSSSQPLVQDLSLADTQSLQSFEAETIFTPVFKPKLPPIACSPRRIHQSPPYNLLTQYTFPQLLESALWNADFDVETTYAQHPEGDGYIFQIALTPKQDLSAHRLKHHFYFLLDRSSSSEKNHFVVFKKATLKALASLKPDDYFNIFVLDKQVMAFRSQTMAATTVNVRAAEEFLDAAGPLLGQGNVYSILDKIPSLIPNDADMHTAILLTDGNASMTTAKKRDCLRKWLSLNQGKLSLYTGAVGKNNALLWLDLLSIQSGGRLVYSDTHAAFPRKLAKLILDLKHPLAKDIAILAKPTRSQTFMELYFPSGALPAFYDHQSYIISGFTDALEPFELAVQGRHHEDWICIEKKIDFTQAKRGDLSFLKQWQRSQATLCYTEFLHQGKPSLLDEAKGILNRSQKEISFP